MSWFTDVRDQVYRDTGVDKYLEGNPQVVAGAVEGIGRAVGDTVKGSGSPSPTPAAASTPIAQAAAVVKDNKVVFMVAGGLLVLALILRSRR
jgi:hypothetical protein